MAQVWKRASESVVSNIWQKDNNNLHPMKPH